MATSAMVSFLFTAACVTDVHGACRAPLDAATRAAIPQSTQRTLACAKSFELGSQPPDNVARTCSLQRDAVFVTGAPYTLYEVKLTLWKPEFDANGHYQGESPRAYPTLMVRNPDGTWPTAAPIARAPAPLSIKVHVSALCGEPSTTNFSLLEEAGTTGGASFSDFHSEGSVNLTALGHFQFAYVQRCETYGGRDSNRNLVVTSHRDRMGTVTAQNGHAVELPGGTRLTFRWAP